MTTNVDFPADENGDVLRRMQADGDDLSKPRDIEFFFAFPEEQNATAFAEEIQISLRLRATVSFCRESGVWQATAVTHAIPDHSAITRLEQELTELAQNFGGESEGWGCMQG